MTDATLRQVIVAKKTDEAHNIVAVGELKDIFDQIDKLWADLMDRGDQRFKFVSLMLGRVVDGSLALDQVAGLPKGDATLASGSELPAVAEATAQVVPPRAGHGR